MFTTQKYILSYHQNNFYLHRMDPSVYTVCKMVFFTSNISLIHVSYVCQLDKESPPFISRNGRLYVPQIVPCSLCTLRECSGWVKLKCDFVLLQQHEPLQTNLPINMIVTVQYIALLFVEICKPHGFLWCYGLICSATSQVFSRELISNISICNSLVIW